MSNSFAPPGQDSIAQANGLGTRSHHIVSPNGARFDNHIVRRLTAFNESRPVGAKNGTRGWRHERRSE